MSIGGKSFVLTHTFKNISSLKENENRFGDFESRCSVLWVLSISKENGMLAVYLICCKQLSKHRKWSIQTKCTMKLVAASGKCFQRTKNYEFQKFTGNEFFEFISLENMQRDYINDDSILIEAHANIINMTDTRTWQPNQGKSFVLKNTFKNISRFVNDVNKCDEVAFSDIEEHYNIPWRIMIAKFDRHVEISLCCKKAVCEGRKYEIKCEFEVQLISSSGKCFAKRQSHVFNEPNGSSRLFISWEEMKKDYVDNDSINVEIIVNIIDIKDLPCIMPNTVKKFVLSHTVKNVSSIKEGGNSITDIQTRFNIPWKLQIQRLDGFVVLYLHCAKGQNELPKWSVETDFKLKVVSTNGDDATNSYSCIFDNESNYEFWDYLTWEYMEEKLVVNDSVIIEAHVEIRSITGIEDEKPTEKPSGIIIPVGNKNYSMEEWIKMAFDQ